MSLLSIEDLALKIDNKHLLKGLNMHLNAGEVVAVIGPNGAGKTSLIRAISGDIAKWHGQIKLNDQALASYAPNERARQLAVLPQHNTLAFPFLAQDVVRLGRLPHRSGHTIDEQVVSEALAAMDISYLAQRSYPSLSGGEKQRVQLARVMAQIWRSEDAQARVLLLDEPTAALDVAHSQQLMQRVRQFANSGVAVMMVVHDFNLAAAYADRIVAMANGEIAAQGVPERVLSSQNMHDIFAVNATIMAHPTTAKPVVLINE